MSNSSNTDKIYDVLIVGGSTAGWSAALCLGRSLRSCLVLDSGLPCNRSTPHSQNFYTRDGETPAAIREIGRDQVLTTYPTVEYQGDTVVEHGRNLTTENGRTLFELTTDTGAVVHGKKLIFATGVRDVHPADIVGFTDCWGVSVIHCPYCHGFEHKKRPTALLIHQDSCQQAMHMMPLIQNVVGTEHPLTILTHGKTTEQLGFTQEQLSKLQQHNINILTQPLVKIEHDKGYLTKVKFDGDKNNDLTVAAMYALIRTEPACRVPMDELGCQTDAGGYLVVNGMQATNVRGIFACGDNTTFMRTIAKAVGAGNAAGASVNMELANESW